jgi:LysM repeat protein
VGAVVLLVLLGNVAYGGSSGGTQVVTVVPGDTVWSIASAHYPDDGDLRQRVDDILSINHLSGGTLVPGQALTIPPP